MGQISQDPGFVIFRDDSLSSDQYARFFEYNTIIDRSAASGNGMGYMIFIGDRGKIRCNSSSVVLTVPRRDIMPTTLSSQEEINSYKSLYQQIYQASRINQSVANQVEPILSIMNGIVRKIELGDTLKNGKWLTAVDRLHEKRDLEKVTEKEKINSEISEFKSRIKETADIKSLKMGLEVLKNRKVEYKENTGAIAAAIPEINSMISDLEKQQEKNVIAENIKRIKERIITTSDVEGIKSQIDLFKKIDVKNKDNQEVVKNAYVELSQLLTKREEALKASVQDKKNMTDLLQKSNILEKPSNGLNNNDYINKTDLAKPQLRMYRRGPIVHGFQIGMTINEFINNIEKENLKIELRDCDYVSPYNPISQINEYDLGEPYNSYIRKQENPPRFMVFFPRGTQHSFHAAEIKTIGDDGIIIEINFVPYMVNRMFSLGEREGIEASLFPETGGKLPFEDFCQLFIDKYGIRKLSGTTNLMEYRDPSGWAIVIGKSQGITLSVAPVSIKNLK